MAKVWGFPWEISLFMTQQLEKTHYYPKEKLIKDGILGTAIGVLGIGVGLALDLPIWGLNNLTTLQAVEAIVGGLGFTFGLNLLLAPNFIITGLLADENKPPTEMGALASASLVGLSELGGGAVIAGLIGAGAAALNNDLGMAGFLLGTVPLTGGFSRFMWNSAKRRLQ